MDLEFEDHTQCEVLTEVAGAQLLTRMLRPKVRRYDAGAVVWTADDRPTRLFTLKAGRVEIASLDASGRETLVQSVKPGELFGELCFCACKGEPLGTVARSMVVSKVIELPIKEFQSCLHRNSDVLNNVLKTFCVRLADAEQRTRILAIHDAQERLQQLLLYLARKRGGPTYSRNDRCIFTVSHTELAALAALSRPHVTLLMTKLRSCSIVSYRRGSALSVHLSKLQGSIDDERSGA